MLKYLIVLLDDTSVPFCCYNNSLSEKRLIDVDVLKEGILFAMKRNLKIQFVYPYYDLPDIHKDIIEEVSHSKIVPFNYVGSSEIIVLDGWDRLPGKFYLGTTSYVLRTSLQELCENYHKLESILMNVSCLRIVLTDIETYSNLDFLRYKDVLIKISILLENLYRKGLHPQMNLLTDRMILDQMNNCNAGCESITLAPNGNFYICPAFYLEDETELVGTLKNGLNIINKQLYKLEYAPICKICDAYQCKRCIYLNKKMTLEVNTPSKEQCITAHIERNASRILLERIREYDSFPNLVQIEEITYLDPFEKITKYTL